MGARVRRRYVARAVAAAVLLAIGGGVYAWWSYEHHVPGLDAARARWHALGWHDYSFEYHRSCFCPIIDAVVTVRGAAVTSAVSRERPATGVRDSGWQHQSEHPIDWFFDKIRDATPGADSYSVTFDPRTGAPTSFLVDPDSGTMDDEWGVSIANVKRLG